MVFHLPFDEPPCIGFVEATRSSGVRLSPTVGAAGGLCFAIPGDQIECDEEIIGDDLWVFYKNKNYTRAVLAGPPVGPPNSMDPNISVAYGTCTHF